jgi:sugar phosphate isomerase/epimerase
VALSKRFDTEEMAQHGNPLHPDPDIARAHHETWRKTLELAQRLEVDTVVAFSGCPGDGPGASRPNWVTCPWPPDFLEILEWQWSERVIPYWLERPSARPPPACGSASRCIPG